MKPTIPLFLANPEDVAHGLISPYAVLLDADESGWLDVHASIERVEAMLVSGCRYFVCSGKGAEELHDLVDDVFVIHDRPPIITTAHVGESETETLRYLIHCASHDMLALFVAVEGLAKWAPFVDAALRERGR